MREVEDAIAELSARFMARAARFGLAALAAAVSDRLAGEPNGGLVLVSAFRGVAPEQEAHAAHVAAGALELLCGCRAATAGWPQFAAAAIAAEALARGVVVDACAPLPLAPTVRADVLAELWRDPGPGSMRAPLVVGALLGGASQRTLDGYLRLARPWGHALERRAAVRNAPDERLDGHLARTRRALAQLHIDEQARGRLAAWIEAGSEEVGSTP